MNVHRTKIEGLLILKPKIFKDHRGYFFECFNEFKLEESAGVSFKPVQSNQSFSLKGVLRGLHYQKGVNAQAKLIQVIKGRVLDICVDLRKDSSTFGQSFSTILDDIEKEMLYIPRGFAHGFLTLSEQALFLYQCDNYYHKASEAGIIYNDKALGIDWSIPENEIILSAKDRNLPNFNEANFWHQPVKQIFT